MKMKPDSRKLKQTRELFEILTLQKNPDDCKYLGKQPRKRQQHEAKEQEALFTWARMQEFLYPALKMLFAVPNGGSRHKLEAANLKKQGVKSGVPDVCLPVPSREYHGLYIEMKSEKGKVSDNQDWWIGKLREYGYKVEVCYSTESAINAIKQYLGVQG